MPVLPVNVSVFRMFAPAVWLRGNVDWLRSPRLDVKSGR
jgi:hypothetical protein